VIEFLIVAFVIFLIVKAANKLQKPAPVAAPTTKPCPECTTEIPLAAKRCPACTAVILV
jgi:large conductance mechanosensitive channel